MFSTAEQQQICRGGAHPLFLFARSFMTISRLSFLFCPKFEWNNRYDGNGVGLTVRVCQESRLSKSGLPVASPPALGMKFWRKVRRITTLSVLPSGPSKWARASALLCWQALRCRWYSLHMLQLRSITRHDRLGTLPVPRCESSGVLEKQENRPVGSGVRERACTLFSHSL